MAGVSWQVGLVGRGAPSLDAATERLIITALSPNS
jgi:hypothetical protein